MTLGCHQKLLLENTRRRWPFGFKGQLEMSSDPVDDLRFFDKRDDSHLATACGTTKRIHFIDLANHLGPLLTSLGMTRRTEPAGFAGKHQEALFPTVWAPDAGKSAHRIAAVEITLDHLLDHRTEIAILLLEPILIFLKKPLKIIKKHPVKNRMFRMTLAVDPCHGRGHDSRNGPGGRNKPQRPDTPGMLK